jgi:hypothetical protein
MNRLGITPITTVKPAPAIGDVYLRGPERRPLSGLLGHLATLLGLDVYGGSLLAERARPEMKAAALTLLVIFLFDLGAWSLLFNTLLHADIKSLDGWSTFAVLAGLLFAVTILLYERQFFTADVFEGLRRVAVPMMVRLLIIVSAALVTAQPVELLFFKEAIAQRAHEEGVRLEALTRRNEEARIQAELAQLRAERTELPQAVMKEPEYLEYLDTQKHLKALRDQVALYQAEVEREASAVGYWRGEMARRSRVAAQAPTPEEREAADAQVARAATALRSAQGRLEQERSALRQAQSLIPDAKRDDDNAFVRFDHRRGVVEQTKDQQIQATQGSEERIERWVRQLREAKPGDPEPIVENAPPAADAGRATSPAAAPSGAGTNWQYHFPRYHFFRQLRVLDDLRSGNPPRWEGVPAAVAGALERQFGLGWERHPHETRLYFWSWLCVYAVSFVIPLLVIAMKFLMVPELKLYYSARCQAIGGNPDAMASLRYIDEAQDTLNAGHRVDATLPQVAGGEPR